MERNYRLKLQRIGKYPFASLLQLLQYGANQSIWVFCVKWFLLNNQTTEKATELAAAEKCGNRPLREKISYRPSLEKIKEKNLTVRASQELQVNSRRQKNNYANLYQSIFW